MPRRHLSVEVGLFLSLYLSILRLVWSETVDKKEIIRRKALLLVQHGRQPTHYAYSVRQLTELKKWLIRHMRDPCAYVSIEEPRPDFFQITVEVAVNTQIKPRLVLDGYVYEIGLRHLRKSWKCYLYSISAKSWMRVRVRKQGLGLRVVNAKQVPRRSSVLPVAMHTYRYPALTKAESTLTSAEAVKHLAA